MSSRKVIGKKHTECEAWSVVRSDVFEKDARTWIRITYFCVECRKLDIEEYEYK